MVDGSTADIYNYVAYNFFRTDYLNRPYSRLECVPQMGELGSAALLSGNSVIMLYKSL